MMYRTVMVFGDTGTQGDTGRGMFGELAQMAWQPNGADTGGDIQVSLVPSAADTGGGWLIYADSNVLGAAFRRVIRQQIHDTGGGQDTGAAPIVAAGDRLRVRVSGGNTGASAGTLYTWWK